MPDIERQKINSEATSARVKSEKEADNIEIRSEEVQEIMGTPPRWIVRWGVVVITGVVLVLLLGSYYYKYPDILLARVTIVSQNPPVSIIARSDGKLVEIFVNDKQKVKAGELLGIIENPANYADVYRLMNFLDSIGGMFVQPGDFVTLDLNRTYNLGQNHALYSSMVSLLRDYKTFVLYNPYDQRIKSLEKEVAGYQVLINRVRDQIGSLKEDYILASNQYHRDSMLHVNGVRSEVETEQSKQAMLKQLNTYQEAMKNLANTQLIMDQKKLQIEEQKTLKTENENKLLASIKEKYDNLVNQLIAWEQAFVLKTPIDGQVTFTNFWTKNQFVSEGNTVFTVVPEVEQEIIGKARVPVAGAGKVETGQRVNIKLDNFPYLEFGLLEGEVAGLSMVPVSSEQGSYYTAEIKLKNQLTTNTGRRLPFNQEMQGYAEIITKDRRLIERLVEPLVAIYREKF